MFRLSTLLSDHFVDPCLDPPLNRLIVLRDAGNDFGLTVDIVKTNELLFIFASYYVAKSPINEY